MLVHAGIRFIDDFPFVQNDDAVDPRIIGIVRKGRFPGISPHDEIRHV